MTLNKAINKLQWTIGLIMIISIAPFTYLAFNKNWLASLFVLVIIIYIFALKLSMHKKFLQNEDSHYLAYVASYLSEIVIISTILIAGAYEIYRRAEVGLWFYLVLGAITISRPLFFVILKKLSK